MALFSRKKETKQEKPKAEKTVEKVSVSASPVSSTADYSFVLAHPRITEKATLVGGNNAYVFDVHPSATKERIAKAIFAQYKVTPRRVNIVTIPRKKVVSLRTHKEGFSRGGKKAYVYLKQGDKIEFA